MPPLPILGLVALQALALGLVLVAAWRLVRGLSPGGPVTGQDMRASRLAGPAGGLTLVASLALVGSIAGWLPRFVPGASCGQGVVEAFGSRGWRALAEWLLALTVLRAWMMARARERAVPESLAGVPARVFLLAVPLVVLAAWDSSVALVGLSDAAPVDCCSRLHQVSAARGAGFRWSYEYLSDLGGAWGAPAVLATAAIVWWRPPKSGRVVGLVAGLALVWAVLAAGGVAAGRPTAWHAGTPEHCVWCRLAAPGGLVSWGLWGMLLAVFVEAASVLIVMAVTRHVPWTSAASSATGRRISLATLGYLVLSVAIHPPT